MFLISLFALIYIASSTTIHELNDKISALEQQIQKIEKQLTIGVKPKPQSEDDDNVIFLNGITQKMSKQFNSTLKDIHLLNIKSLNYPNNLLLILLQNQTKLLIINQLGNTICDFQFENQILYHNIHQFSDEVVLAMMDSESNAYDLSLKYQELNVKTNSSLVRDMREVDEDGYFDYFVLEQERSINIRSIIEQMNQTYYPINTILINQARNSKIFLLGDSHGQIMSIFTNGTFKSKTAVSKDPILNFVRRHPHILYQTTKQLGFINSITLQVAFPLCEKPAEEIIGIYQENIHSHFLYALLKSMEIVVYQIKQGKQSECSINYKIYSSVLPPFSPEQKYALTIGNSYLMLNAQSSPQLHLFNLTLFKSKEYFGDSFDISGLDDSDPQQYQKPRYQDPMPSKPKLMPRNTPPSPQYAHLAIYFKFQLNHMPSYQSAFSFNFLESFRFPMILVAIFVVFIFQFWQKRKKNSEGDDDDDKISLMAKQKIDSMVEEYQQARRNKQGDEDSDIKPKKKPQMTPKQFFEQEDSDKDWLED